MKNTKPVIYLATTKKSLSLEFGCVDSNGGGEKEIEQRDSKVKTEIIGIKSKL